MLRRDGPVLAVWSGRERKAELLVHDLDQLVLMGNITVTPAVLDFLIENRVDTVFMSVHGRYRGRLMHEHSKNVTLRRAQYQQLGDPTVALALARTIVSAKISNSRTFLMKAARRAGGVAEISEAVNRMAALLPRVEQAETLDHVRGFEGAASAHYFSVFGLLLKNAQFTFDERNRRPPLDPVNVLLSLGYTLLANAVETAIQIVGLDPYLGALHEVAYGRPSLVCDLMEEYRSVIVDPMVVACINQRAFAPDDFEEAAGEPIRFKRSGLKWFVELFEKRLRGSLRYEPRGCQLSWRQVIEEQVRQFARSLLGGEDGYRPLLVK
jgi:CRISPR-associated protein Cas1